MRLRLLVRDAPSFVVVALLAALPAVRATVELGRVHPDEIFQYLEPAHRLVHGYGIAAWEWEVGLRNWAIPAVIAAVLQLSSALGATSPMAARASIAVLMFALHFAMLSAIQRYACRRLDRWSALAIAMAVGLYEPVIDLAGRTLSETFSTAFLVWGLERLDPRLSFRRSRAAFGGILLGLAFAARYGAGAALVGAGLWLLLYGGQKRIVAASIGGAITLLLLGALDRLTWGRWFHSFIEYAQYNLISGEAEARFGSAEWSRYLPLFVGGMAPAFWIGLCAPRQRSLLADPFFVTGIAYFVVTSWAAHKESRFLYGVLVLLSVAGSVWALEAARRAGKELRAAAAAGLVALVLAHGGIWETRFRAHAAAEIRLTMQAGRECSSLAVVGVDAFTGGGYFYLGKNIPLRFVWNARAVEPTDACALVFANRSASGLPEGFRVLAEDSGAVLYRREVEAR